MSKIIERITDIKKDTVKTGANIGKSYYRVTLGDGSTAFVWSWPIIKGIKIGDTAQLVIQKKGKFLNITAAAPVSGIEDEEIPSDDDLPEEDINDEEEEEDEEIETVEPTFKSKKVERVLRDAGEVPYEKGKVPDSVWEKKDARIARMSCIKSAIEYATYCASLAKPGSKALSEGDIIECAKLFYDYIQEG